MNWKHTMIACVVAVMTAVGTPAMGLANPADIPPEVQQKLSGEWQELQNLRKEIKLLKATLKKEHQELRTLAEQKQVKLNMVQYHDLMHKVHQLHESDKKLREELKVAGQTRNEAKMKELLRAITAHKRLEVKLLQDAEQLMSSQIKELKQK